jgi:multicomponent Na+:H+ antiporter subunit D
MLAAVLHLATGAWLLYTGINAGIQVLHVASWPAPFGIALVADHLSALMVVITGVIYTAVSVYSRADITHLTTGSGATIPC